MIYVPIRAISPGKYQADRATIRSDLLMETDRRGFMGDLSQTASKFTLTDTALRGILGGVSVSGAAPRLSGAGSCESCHRD